MPTPSDSPYRRANLVCNQCGNDMRMKPLSPDHKRHETAFTTFFCDICRYGIQDTLPHADGPYVMYEGLPEPSQKRKAKAKAAKKKGAHR